MTTDDAGPRALLLDFGGVLTQPILANLDDVDVRNGLEPGTTLGVLTRAYAEGGADSAIARLERGELDLADFETELAAEMDIVHTPGQPGFAAAVFGDLVVGGRLWDATRSLRAAGVRTGLLSNSWGTHGYPEELLGPTFDVRVISGEVGLRKPDAAIFELAVERLGVPASACLFVDDHPANLKAAAALGMVTVLHRGDDAEVLDELTAAFGIDVTDARELTEIRDHPRPA